jgi:PPK2 family polyphosphate:nucleotide phosphotransferase
VPPGARVDLARVAADDRLGIADREEAEALVAGARERIARLQSLLAAEERRALLVVLQGMDASGKDGAAKALVAGLNPMILTIAGFGPPTDLELRHDFLWRIHREVPPRGEIGIWNRSHYEDVLVVRVDRLAPEEVWRPRYEAIADFERRLTLEGVRIVKFLLHISPGEQLGRLRRRAEVPVKRWKYSADDLRKRDDWDAYMAAYEEAMLRTSTEDSPWYVVPADRKWVRNAVILETVAAHLEAMDLPVPAAPPTPPPA